MRVLVVYAHANPKSFNHAILEEFTRGLTGGGHTFEVLDLYAMKFDPCLRPHEFAIIRPKEDQDVLDQQAKVAKADALAFIYPNIWMGFPAILKGWIERVFSYKFAYDLTEKGFAGRLEGRIPLLKHKKALLINTTAWTEEDYKTSGMKDAMEKTMADYALRFPGVQHVEHVFFYHVIAFDITKNVDLSIDKRKRYLELAYRLGKEF
ncbi:MAG: NAD(P)H-dependent oxidoreductase [Candidatus Bathyarchaeota archaeon]|nr:MAG: NAD(P)H-dependent oxidoreductase [Candidatus Bathyarchaeota archaeon]